MTSGDVGTRRIGDVRGIGPRSLPFTAGLLGLAQLLVGGLWSGSPSYWRDEAATLSVIGRSVPEMWRLLADLDAVHGIYYLVQRVASSVVGIAPFPARLTSVVAVALAVSGIVVLGTRLMGPRAGVYAGVSAIFLPGLAWTSAELRSYSATALAAVITVLLLESATRRGGASRWVGYAAALMMSVWVFVFSALLILPLLILAWSRKALIPWAWSTVAAVLASAPIVALSAGQSGQVDWIEDSPVRLDSVLVGQNFFGQRPYGAFDTDLAVAAEMLAALALALLGLFTYRAARRFDAPVLLMVAAWAVVPTMILVGVTLWGKPLYVERYLTFTTPGLCLWLGAVLASMPKRLGVAASTAFCLLALPILVGHRTEGTKPDNYAELARFVAAEKDSSSAAIYSMIDSRGAALSYPEEFAGLDDVSLAGTPEETGTLWGRNLSASDLAVGDLAGRKVFVFNQTSYPTGYPRAADPRDVLDDDPYLVRLRDAGCQMGETSSATTVTAYVMQC